MTAMEENEAKALAPQWADTLNCAITVCDAQGVIMFMNQRARDTYAAHGNLIGRNLRDCHPARALAIIDRLLGDGGTNAYTIQKLGQRKMIYQSAWRLSDGTIGGLVEISMVIPDEMPHYVRS